MSVIVPVTVHTTVLETSVFLAHLHILKGSCESNNCLQSGQQCIRKLAGTSTAGTFLTPGLSWNSPHHVFDGNAFYCTHTQVTLGFHTHPSVKSLGHDCMGVL